MPLPILFIGIAAATGAVGIGTGVKAGIDNANARQINNDANSLVQNAAETIDLQRTACGKALESLGQIKLSVLNSDMQAFLDSFSRIKNVDFRDNVEIDDLKKFHIDKKEFDEMQELVSFAGAVTGGIAAGSAGGALTALGAYGAVQTIAAASTGTAIASLSGAAATNATLAFFGGGAIAAGGGGMALGSVVLGGLVAGPALMVVGLAAGKAAEKNLDQAYTNKFEAIRISEELSAASLQCEAIRRRTYMFYDLLARLDSYFLPLIWKMEEIIGTLGDDYSTYPTDAKKAIASCASIAVTIKSVLDTPLLTEDGLLTDGSAAVLSATQEKLLALK